MKKLLALAFVPFALMSFGCDDDNGGNIKDLCNVTWDDGYNFSSLTADQQKQLKETAVAACTNSYENLPYCKDEYLDYDTCAFVDTDDAYWDQIDIKVMECEDDYDGAEQIASCIEAVYGSGTCGEVYKKMMTCESAYGNELESYYKTTTSAYKAMSNLLTSWGLDIDEYEVYYDESGIDWSGWENE